MRSSEESGAPAPVRDAETQAGKRAAGRRAAELVEDGMLVGLGTGSTAAAFLDRLGERVRAGLHLTGVPTSIRTADHARRVGIPLLSIEDVVRVDLACDGADEVDPQGRLVKGLGGALLREKRVARMAARFVVMVDRSKLVPHLGATCPVPVEFEPQRHAAVAAALERLGARPVLREAEGSPYVTDNGNRIFDAWFPALGDPAALERAIDAEPGVLGNGLFVGLTHLVLVGSAEGVSEWTPRPGGIASE